MVEAILSRSKDGKILHLISFRFKSTAWSANLLGSIIGARSASLAPSLPCTFFSQPTALGLTVDLSIGDGKETVPNRLFHDPFPEGTSASLQHRIRRVVMLGYRVVRYARRFRSGHPGFVGRPEGSWNPMVCWTRIRTATPTYLASLSQIMEERSRRTLRTCLGVQLQLCFHRI